MTTTAPSAERMDKHHQERIAADRKARAAFDDWQEKHPRRPAIPEREREQAAIMGLERTAKRLRREGEEARAAQCDTLLARAREQVQAAALARAEWEQHAHPTTILRDAALPIGKRLLKAIGGFTDESEAAAWVERYMPLTEARREATRAADEMHRLSRTANTATRAFWQAIEEAGRLAFARLDDAANVRELVGLGVM